MTHRAIPAAIAALMASVTTACVSVLPEQPRPEAVYQLAEAETRTEIESLVVVREPDAPRLLASRSIVSQSADGGLRVVPGVAWADRLTRMLQVALIDSISPSGAGMALDDSAGVSGQYELHWRVTDFALKGSEGVCTVQLTLLDGASREPVAQTRASAQAAVSGEGNQARARALAAAGSGCAQQAAEFLQTSAVPATPEDH